MIKNVLTSVKSFDIIHIENDKRDGDIGQISQWFPFCLHGCKCKNHFNGGNLKVWKPKMVATHNTLTTYEVKPRNAWAYLLAADGSLLFSIGFVVCIESKG